MPQKRRPGWGPPALPSGGKRLVRRHPGATEDPPPPTSRPYGRGIYPYPGTDLAPVDEDLEITHPANLQEELGADDTIDYNARYNQDKIPGPTITKIQTSNHASAPVDGQEPPQGTGTAPDVLTRPFVPENGNPTSTLIFMLKAPLVGTAAVANAGGFVLVIWMRNRISKQWGATQSITLPYDEWWGTGDFNGGELFFQITAASVATNGGVEVHTLEQA